MISALALGAGGGDSLGYLAASTLEECLEMAGITLFVVALLLHVRNEFRAGGVQFS